MKIQKEILDNILHLMPISPPEAGGIIGGKEGRISTWTFDAGYPECGCVYRPNVKYLNKVIEEWLKEDREFMGILHVHFGGASRLSEGDIEYIERIMKAMPETIKFLYFPIVVQPERKMVPYVARYSPTGEIEIGVDELEIVRM